MTRRIFVAAALAAALGCGKEEASPGGPSASSRDAVIEAWKKGGLTASALTPANVAFGKDCRGGTVNGVDLLLCEFPADAEAKAAEEPALAWVGEATGIARAAGKVLVVAADRRKADPTGRTINQLTKLLTPK